MMYNDISARDVQLIFFLATAVLKRRNGFHSRFRFLSGSLRSILLHVRYIQAEFAAYFILPFYAFATIYVYLKLGLITIFFYF